MNASAAAAPGTGLVYHPDFLLHDTSRGHPERPARLEAAVDRLESTGLMDRLVPIEARPVEERWLLTVHTQPYLDYLRASVPAEGYVRLDPDTVMSPRSLDAALLASGGVLAAVDAVMEGRVRNAFVAARPPGHHAPADRAMGFCLVNHIAVAARYLQTQHGLERVLIVDWDVHHGNGTQDIFYSDPTVFYFSSHQYPYYPGTGAADETGDGAGRGATMNVPLRAGTGDDEIVAIYRDQLNAVADRFHPQFVLVSAGFDAHRDDPLAQLDVTEAGYRDLTAVVKAIAEKHAAGRLVSVLEGGYDLDALGRSVEAHVLELLAQ